MMLVNTKAKTHELDDFDTHELLEIFKRLDAPSIDEMNGEYQARLLKQPSLLASFIGYLSVGNPFKKWLCKAFRPVSETHGRGYNTFKVGSKIIQQFPMMTLIAPSRFDGKPSYHLVYRDFESMCGDINMVDEVRVYAPGVYLGIGTWGFTDTQRKTALPFILTGPGNAYRKDIGVKRKGFSLGSREIPALSS